MIPETLILTIIIAAALWTVRHHWREIRGVWREAKWWEKLALVLCLAPIPGPVDEIAGVLVVRRVIARRRA